MKELRLSVWAVFMGWSMAMEVQDDWWPLLCVQIVVLIPALVVKLSGKAE